MKIAALKLYLKRDRKDKRTPDLLNWCFIYVFSEEYEDGAQTETAIIFLDTAKNRGIRQSVDNNRNNVRYKTDDFTICRFLVFFLYIHILFVTVLQNLH